MEQELKRIAFIGAGVMGAPMAGHLIDAGYEVHLYTRTQAKAEPLVRRGAIWHGSPAEAVAGADAAITIVGFPPADVEAVYFAEDGPDRARAARRAAHRHDDTAPSLSVRIYEAAKARGVAALDAPVSGGDVGARNATLSIMAGGDAEAYARGAAAAQPPRQHGAPHRPRRHRAAHQDGQPDRPGGRHRRRVRGR